MLLDSDTYVDWNKGLTYVLGQQNFAENGPGPWTLKTEPYYSAPHPTVVAPSSTPLSTASLTSPTLVVWLC